MSDEEIGNLLNRSPASIQQKRCIIGAVKYRKGRRRQEQKTVPQNKSSDRKVLIDLVVDSNLEKETKLRVLKEML